MDAPRFDSLTRSLAAAKSRRGFLATLAAAGAGLLGARAAGAQVRQAQCGNKLCASNPAVCTAGCVCCVYPNGNSRCRPPQDCTSPGTVVSPPTTTTTTTAAPAACSTGTCPACFTCVGIAGGAAICPNLDGRRLIQCDVGFACTSLADCVALNPEFNVCAVTSFGGGNDNCVPAGQGRCGTFDYTICSA